MIGNAVSMGNRWIRWPIRRRLYGADGWWPHILYCYSPNRANSNNKILINCLTSVKCTRNLLVRDQSLSVEESFKLEFCGEGKWHNSLRNAFINELKDSINASIEILKPPIERGDIAVFADYGCLLVVLFYGVTTLFRSFNTELNFKQFSLV